MAVDIISKELIKPSSSTPSDLRDFKLSFLDQLIPPTYVPLIFHYSNKNHTKIEPPEMSKRLKTSLSETLTRFYPLAGTMNGLTSVDCDDGGVLYVEARVDGKISEIMECGEIEVLDNLIPYKYGGIMMGVKEQLAIQVSFFDCGGIAIGACISHRIADACSFCSFINAWAAAARGDGETIRPVFNAPDLFPPTDSPQFRPTFRNPAIQPSTERLATKRFKFPAPLIDALKSRLGKRVRPTRVEAISALIWKCAAILSSTRGGDTASVAFHPVNLRPRKVPPLPEYSFGNLFQMAWAVTDDVTDLDCLVTKLRDSMEKINGEYVSKLLGVKGTEIMKNNFAELGKILKDEGVKVYRFSSWCRFPVYEADFGWGRPDWVCIAGYATKNSIFFMDCSDGRGLEAWVVLEEEKMAKFEQELEIQTLNFVGSMVV